MPEIPRPVPLGKPFARLAPRLQAWLEQAARGGEAPEPRWLRSMESDAARAVRIAESHRREDCGHYSACLWRAAAEAWPGWSCVRCPAYARTPRRPELVDVLSMGVQALVSAISSAEDVQERRALMRSDQATPPVIVDERGRLVHGRVVVVAAILERRSEVEAVRVGIGDCPVCADNLLLDHGRVSTRGWCDVCRGKLVAAELGEFRVIEGERDRAAEADRRERRGGSFGGELTVSAGMALAGAVQLGLWG